jgi:hypothetical protein
MLSKTRLFTKKINNNIILSRLYRPTHFPVDDEKISNNNNNNNANKCNDDEICFTAKQLKHQINIFETDSKTLAHKNADSISTLQEKINFLQNYIEQLDADLRLTQILYGFLIFGIYFRVV